MKGKKTSIEDAAKVIEAKINNPNLSSRDLERETGISKSVAGKIISEELGQVSTYSELLAKRIDSNNNLIDLADRLIKQKSEEGDVKVSELVSVKKVAWEQNQVMTGGDTSRMGISSGLDQEQKVKLAQLILTNNGSGQEDGEGVL